MLNLRIPVLIVAFGSAFFIMSISTASSVLIGNCTTINVSDSYFLSVNITNWDSGHCFIINTSDVTFDCQNNYINASIGGYKSGFYFNGSPSSTLSNITIKNCRVNDWFYGIFSNNTQNSIVTNSLLKGNEYGLYLSYSNSFNITSVNITGGQRGIYIRESHSAFLNEINISYILYNAVDIFLSNYSKIYNSTFMNSSNGYGIYAQRSNLTTVMNSVVKEFTQSGICFYSSGFNDISNILFNNSNNLKFTSTIYPNTWNSTLECTSGSNILGYPCSGGNYWGHPNGTGYSDVCQDGNRDGICSVPFSLEQNNTDYLTLTEPDNLTNCTMISSPGIYVLENDIIQSHENYCFLIKSSNVEIDCQGHLVDGNGSQDVYGIFSNGTSSTNYLYNISVKNCNYSDWGYSIRYRYTSNSSISNVSIITSYTTGTGIMLEGGNWMNITGITVRNSEYGLRLSSNSYNIINRTYIDSCQYCVYLSGAHHNLMQNLHIKNGQYAGTYLSFSHENTISDSLFSIFSDLGSGINLLGSNSNTAKNISVYNAGRSGIYFNTANSNDIYDSYFEGINGTEGYGLYFTSNSEYNNISHVDIVNSKHGVRFSYSNHTRMTNSRIENCSQSAIFVQVSYNNSFFNNFLNNSDNIAFSGIIHFSNWNTTKDCISGQNIAGGPCIAGNYWGSPDGTGFSEMCPNSTDGICDDYYFLNASNIDYLPIVEYSIPPQWDFWNFTNFMTGEILSSTLNLGRTDTLNVSAHWYNYTFGILSAVITHNGTGSATTYAVPGPFYSNWTNYTINLSNTVEFPRAGFVTISSVRAYDLKGENSTHPEMTLSFWGYASVENITLSPEYIYGKKSVQIMCKVADENSSYPLNNYSVSFYNGTSLIGVNDTGYTQYGDGWAVLDYTDSSENATSYNITCNITDEPGLLYNPSPQNWKKALLNIVKVGADVYFAQSPIGYRDIATVFVNISGNITPISAVSLNISYKKIEEGGSIIDAEYYYPSMGYNASSPSNHIYEHAFTANFSGVYNTTIIVNISSLDPFSNSSLLAVSYGSPEVEFVFPNFRIMGNQTFNMTINLTSVNGDLWLSNVTLNLSMALSIINLTQAEMPSKPLLYNLTNGSVISIKWVCISLFEGLTRALVNVSPENGTPAEFSMPFSVIMPMALAEPGTVNKTQWINFTARIVGNTSRIDFVDFSSETPELYNCGCSVYSPTEVKNESECVETGAGTGNIAKEANASCSAPDDCDNSIDEDNNTNWVDFGTGSYINLSFPVKYIISRIEIMWKDSGSGSNVTLYYSNGTGDTVQIKEDIDIPDSKNTTVFSDFIPFSTSNIFINQTTASSLVVYEIEVFSVEERYGQCFVYICERYCTNTSGIFTVNTTVYTNAGFSGSNFSFMVNFGKPVVDISTLPTMISGRNVTYSVNVTAVQGDIRNLNITLNVQNRTVLNMSTGSWDHYANNITEGLSRIFEWNMTTGEGGETDTNVTVNSTNSTGSFACSNLMISVFTDAGAAPVIHDFWMNYSGIGTNRTNLFTEFSIFANATDDVGMKSVRVNITYPSGFNQNGTMEKSGDLWHFVFGEGGNDENLELNETGDYSVNIIAADIGDNETYECGPPCVSFRMIEVVDTYNISPSNIRSVFNRGELLEFGVFDINGIGVGGLNFSVNITQPGSTEQNIFQAFNGTYSYNISPSDPDGYSEIKINASRNGNKGSGQWIFNVSSGLSVNITMPLSGDKYDASQAISTMAYITDARGQFLSWTYDASVLCNGEQNPLAVTPTYCSGGCHAPGQYGADFSLQISVWDCHNNSGTSSIGLKTITKETPGGGPIRGGSTTISGGISPAASCNCTEWRNIACGIGNCTEGQMFQTRTCAIATSLCPESRCTYFEECLEKADFDFQISEEELEIKQGEERNVKIRVNNTGNSLVGINVSAFSFCSVAKLSEEMLEIDEGGTLDVFMSLRIPLNQSTGDCPVTIMLSSFLNKKAKGIKLIVTKGEVTEMIEQQQQKLDNLREKIYELAIAGADIDTLFILYRNITWASKDVKMGIQRDDSEEIDIATRNLESQMAYMESQINSLMFFKPFIQYRWYIIAGIVEFVIVAYLVTQLLWPLFRLGREIIRLGMKEKELVQTRINTEKQYFKRQIDENTFNTILVKKQEEILKTRGQLTTKKSEMGSIFRERLSPAALWRWVSEGPRRLGSRISHRAGKKRPNSESE